MPGKNLCLLSLDGGVIRGLSSLHILRELMKKIEPNRHLKPCEYFDMIGGTSTGGLMAIMLGRLRMDIDECINAYMELCNRIFTKKKTLLNIKGKIQGRFDTKVLEEGIKKIVRDKTGSEDTLLRDDPNAPCKTFVCATRRDATATMQFTSYKSHSDSDLLKTTKIWEAARATSAAPSFFDPIKIGRFGEEFGDGGTGANNPVRILWNQAQYCLGQGGLVERNLRYLVSIGTSIPSLEPFGDHLMEVAKTLRAIATETEMTAKSFREEYAELAKQNRYFRFNVSRGLEKILLEDATKTAAIVAATREYVGNVEVAERMRLCGRI
ncbi:hypothetical protein GJ744_001444 [Endocarpon pusillum]|uniref:PNPLA domain-containing protein n=1 Tax=Endocarpon pusillum TaxID=364733 RepID=A0A8H7AS28_9EURO|nr:hypothetical protein GJ744_001444 [Endocarpon pusillum]